MKPVLQRMLFVFGLISIVVMLDGLDGCDNNMGATNQNGTNSMTQENSKPQQLPVGLKSKLQGSVEGGANLLGDGKYLQFAQQLNIDNGVTKDFLIRDEAIYKQNTTADNGKAFAYVLAKQMSDKQFSVLQAYPLDVKSGTFSSQNIISSERIDSECGDCSIEAILVSPTKPVLYVLEVPSKTTATGVSASAKNTKIIEYAINQDTGAATYVDEHSVLMNITSLPKGMTVSPDGRFLYVVSAGGSRGNQTFIAKYKIDDNGLMGVEKPTVLPISGTAIGPLEISYDDKYAALIVNGTPNNTVQLFNIVDDELIKSGKIDFTNQQKENPDLPYLSPLQLLISPDSAKLYVIFKQTNILATYDYQNSTVKYDRIEFDSRDKGEFEPNSIGGYMDTDKNFYLLVGEKDGMWARQEGALLSDVNFVQLSTQAASFEGGVDSHFVVSSFDKMNNIYFNRGGKLLAQGVTVKIPLTWNPDVSCPEFKDAYYNKVNHDVWAKCSVFYEYSQPSCTRYDGEMSCSDGGYPSFVYRDFLTPKVDWSVDNLIKEKYSCHLEHKEIGDKKFSNELKCVENSN